MEATRRARVSWTGDLARGKGAVTAESSGLFKEAPVTWASRTERSVGNAGTPPDRLDVTATVTFDQVAGGGFKVKSSALEVTGKVPKIDAQAFQAAAQGAKENCPISQALKGNVELSVKATLT